MSSDTHHSASAMGERKAQHLDICVQDERYQVESGTAGFEQILVPHRSLPEISYDDISTEREFLGRPVAAPFIISSMTGGSAEGYKANKDLAKLAQEMGLAVGMGSIRILFRKPEVFDHFHLRPLAPDVPIFANLAGQQIRDMEPKGISETLKRLEVDGIAVHLNPGQELVQPGGDRDFSSVLDAVARWNEQSPVPVIVKETGFGIHPAEAQWLLDRGIQHVDLAGRGGTNWATVEAHRIEGPKHQIARELDHWGMPTAAILAALVKMKPSAAYEKRIIASGGLRTGIDLAKALIMGAGYGAAALPVIRALHHGAMDGARNYIDGVVTNLKRTMLLLGAANLDHLANIPWRSTGPLVHWIDLLSQELPSNGWADR